MRIIAGIARGRRIDAPKGLNTRPTLDRVKEGMFGMIQFEIENRTVLDLFAGSGNLGLEALSRGAASAVFCDRSKEAAAVIERNVNNLGFRGKAQIYCCDSVGALDRLATAGERFSLVFLDPPYASGVLENTILKLERLKLLAPGCLIVAEHAFGSSIELNAAAFNMRPQRKYGDVAVSIIRYEGDSSGE